MGSAELGKSHYWMSLQHASPYLGQQPARYAEIWLQILDIHLYHLPLIAGGQHNPTSY